MFLPGGARKALLHAFAFCFLAVFSVKLGWYLSLFYFGTLVGIQHLADPAQRDFSAFYRFTILLPVLLTAVLTLFSRRQLAAKGKKRPLARAFLLSHLLTCSLILAFNEICKPRDMEEINMAYYLYSFLGSFPLVWVANSFPEHWNKIGGPLLNGYSFVVWSSIQWGAVLFVFESLWEGMGQAVGAKVGSGAAWLAGTAREIFGQSPGKSGMKLWRWLVGLARMYSRLPWSGQWTLGIGLLGNGLIVVSSLTLLDIPRGTQSVWDMGLVILELCISVPTLALGMLTAAFSFSSCPRWVGVTGMLLSLSPMPLASVLAQFLAYACGFTFHG
jgi:hypothetical protein